MKQFTKILVAGLALSLASTLGAYAGAKPSGSRSAKAAEIKKIYSGSSWKWSKGGGYYAKNGKFNAIWETSVGIGTWSVSSSGTLCNSSTWFWDDDGLVKKKDKNCNKHVVAKDGKIWQRHHKKNDWYPLNLRKISKGNKFGSKFKRLKKKIGI